MSPLERATLADLRIDIGSSIATLHVDGEASEHSIRVALYGLADGLAHEWWKIFGGRGSGVSLKAYFNGYLFPDIQFAFDGMLMDVWAEQTDVASGLRFFSTPIETLGRMEAEATFAGILESIFDRLENESLARSNAALCWTRVCASRHDPDEAAFCEAAGALSLNPYAIADSDANTIARAASAFEGEPLIEFLEGARRYDVGLLLDWVQAALSSPEPSFVINGLKDFARCVEAKVPARPYEKAWVLGYRRARAARRELNRDEHYKFKSVARLAASFAARSASSAPAVNGIRALRADRGENVHVHLRGGQVASSYRLAGLAAAIGDVCCFPSQATATINDLPKAYRQAADRAFAAELLAPINEIMSMVQDRKDSLSIAAEFGVSPTMVGRQIENRDRIAAACLDL